MPIELARSPEGRSSEHSYESHRGEIHGNTTGLTLAAQTPPLSPTSHSPPQPTLLKTHLPNQQTPFLKETKDEPTAFLNVPR